MALADRSKIFRHPAARTVALPGGLPRHYRVQAFDERTMTWKLHGVYARHADAEQAIVGLERAGRACRLVECRHCAVAV